MGDWRRCSQREPGAEITKQSVTCGEAGTGFSCNCGVKLIKVLSRRITSD